VRTSAANSGRQLDRARHPYELPVSRHSYLFIDDAVHGIGSRSCGVDVLPRYALWPSLRQFSLTFARP
jgi:beta-galactosidase